MKRRTKGYKVRWTAGIITLFLSMSIIGPTNTVISDAASYSQGTTENQQEVEKRNFSDKDILLKTKSVEGTEKKKRTSEFKADLSANENSTDDAPIEIWTREDLEAVKDNLHGNYKLMKDIDLKGEDWTPIEGAFYGTFDGNHKVIKNMQINIKSAKSRLKAGLFEQNNGDISNLGIESGSVTIRSTEKQEYSSDLWCGGIAGYQYRGTIRNCYNNADVTAKGRAVADTYQYVSASSFCQVGGIVGLDEYGTIECCYNTGKISSDAYSRYSLYSSSGVARSGGIAGTCDSGKILNCYNIGEGTSNAYAYYSSNVGSHCGGIVGLALNMTLNNCYNITKMQATSDFFETGSRAVSMYTGGVVGRDSNSKLQNCYYSRDAIGTTLVGTALSREEMEQKESYVGFDFDTCWEFNTSISQYPILQGITNASPRPGYKPVEDVNMTTPGDSGSIRLFQDTGGSIGNAPIAKIFPGDYSLKFPMIQTGVAKESMEDGTYKYKMTIGLDKNMAFGSAKAWDNLKKDFADAKKNLDRVNTLNTLMKKWGASRGSFNLTKSFKAKPDMEVAGYYEAICDENGRVISDSGGVLLSAKWSASTTNQFLAGPVPLYLELGGSLKAVGKGGLERALQDSNLSLTGTVTVSPGLSLEGGVGVSGVATVGAKGDADVAIQLVPWSKGTFHGGASITAKLIFVFDWEYSVLKVTCPIWDNTRQAKMAAFFTDEAAIKELSLTDRSYQKYTTQWKGQPASAKNSRSLARTQSEASGAAAWELQGYVLPDTIPLMKQAGDDTVLVFQSNDAQRNTQNSTKLMYSVYDGSAWSQPKALWDNGTLDTFADLEQVGEDLYVVWQKCREPLTGSDVNALSEQAAKSSEICWAKYDPEKKAFDTPQYLTNNSLPDTMPALAEDAETPTVMWVQNNKTDLTGLSGTKTIFTSQLTENQWSEPEKMGETDAYLSQLVGISQGGTEKAAYLGSPASGGLPAVYLAESGTETQIAKSEETPISGLDCGDGAITYKKDGVLEQYQIADGTLSQWKAGQSQAVGSNARIYSLNGKETLLWMTNEGDGCTFYASVKMEEGYSEPVEVYQKKKLQGNYFTAQPAKTGGWEIVLNASETANEEKTSLYFIQTESQPKVELEDVVLNENEMEDANQPFAYSVTNDSEETITQFQLTVKDGTKVLVDKTISQRILPGETVYLKDTVDLSGVKETANLTIQAMAPGQIDSEGSSREQTVQMADLEVTVEKTVLDKSVRFTATVTNTGKVVSDGDVILYGDAEGNRKIASRHFDSIAPGETASVELEYPVSSMIFQEEESAYCMVQTVTDKEEFNADNNTYYGATYLWELPEDNFQIAGFTLSGAEGTYTYTGKAIRPAVTVKGLTAGKDYTVSYRNNVNAGTAQVVVTGIGRYHGTMVKKFTIRKASQTVAGKSYTKTYGNKAFSLGAKAKTKLSYTSSNTKVATVNSAGKVTLKGPGKATITITAAATANYNAASKNVTITVKPKKVAGLKVKKGKKRMTVSWKRDKKVTGYQITYAQNKKFKKGKKTITISKNKTIKRTVKKLKARKTYYVKVRAYKKVGKMKLYGGYSKVKKVKTR